MWLFICCGMVFAMVILGGVTRLTESGLSITEWKPITGIIPPTSTEEWEKEFDKYKQSPEYRKLNFGMTLQEFKNIFYMEWAHRAWGRVIGVAFIIPFTYFGYIRGKLLAKCVGLLSLGGLQGVLGWYMVKSGLNAANFEETNSVPRVSQYRLAAHLSAAVALYASMLWMGMDLIAPHKYKSPVAQVGTLQKLALGTTALVFVTVFSGAFVAGLDAGLIYNTFPLMAEQVVPEGLWRLSPIYKNLFENDTTVQFNHRSLGITTLLSSTALYLLFLRKRKVIPRTTGNVLHLMYGVTLLQVILGISTLLTYVPVPLAASHQAGAMTLLTVALCATKELKRIPKVK